MEYDLEITRCIQSSVARQQHQEQQEKELIDEHEDQLKQQQQMSQIRVQHLTCQAATSDQMPLNLNTETGDVQHSYINSNADGNAAYGPSACEHSGNWDSAQNTHGNYVDFLGPHDVAVKRCRFDQG